MKQKLFFSVVALGFAITANAQKPFKEIGKIVKVELLTLSNGRYVEYFTNDTLRRIGSVMFNTVTNKVEYFIPQDDIAWRAELDRAKEASRWLSVDPLASKYPDMSPYCGMGNNPISFIDGDGREIKPANNAAVAQLGNVFNSFNGRDDDALTGADLFGVQSRLVGFENAPQQVVFSTSLTPKEFAKNLRNSNLSASQKKEATAIYKILSSEDIYEVGTVKPTSELNDGVSSSGTAQGGNVKFVTNNNDANVLLNKTKAGALSNSQVQDKLKTQENSGSTPNGGAFGLFTDYY